MAEQKKRSRTGDRLAGLFFILLGIFPMLAGFDIGPLGADDINGPAWLGFASGGVFVAAGLAVLAGDRHPLLKHALAVTVLAGLAAIGNWIAFGAGERICSGSLPLLVELTGEMSGLACRIPFGFGALIVDAITLYTVLVLMERSLGNSPTLARIKKISEVIILVILSPLLVPLVLLLAGWIALGVVRERIMTGAWPKNESFQQDRKK